MRPRPVVGLVVSVKRATPPDLPILDLNFGSTRVRIGGLSLQPLERRGGDRLRCTDHDPHDLTLGTTMNGKPLKLGSR